MKHAGAGLAGLIILFAICFVMLPDRNATEPNVDEIVENDVGLVDEIVANENLARATLKIVQTSKIMKAKGMTFDVDKEILAAVGPATAHRGYFYIQNHTIAIPAEYGKSGKQTFALVNGGEIVWKDTGKTPITETPTDLSTWKSED